MEKFVVLTYNVPHRKTFDLLSGLMAYGHKPEKVYSTPFHYQKKFKPKYEHRPGVVYEIDTATLCKNLDIPHEEVPTLEELVTKSEIENKTALIAGAGIIPASLCSKMKIINSHPGILPLVRGLDAVKWSILEGKQVGVTLHLVTPEVDAGEILERKTIPIYSGDTFHSIAFRNYEMEIKMMIESVVFPGKSQGYGDSAAAEGIAHKRMSHEVEATLMSMVPAYVQKYATLE